MEKLKIHLAGGGKVARSVVHRLAGGQMALGWWNRHVDHIESLAQDWDVPVIRDLTDLGKDADVVLLAIPDQRVGDLAKQIPSGALVLHCAGSLPLDALHGHARRGVWYPLHAFYGQPLAAEVWSQIPQFLECHDSADRDVLLQFSSCLGGPMHWLDSTRRKELHLSAVMAQNFSNAMWTELAAWMKARDLDFSLLQHLLQQHLDHLGAHDPADLQTGPAIRGDQSAIQEHLGMLEQSPELQELYRRFTQLIQQRHGR